MEVMTASLFCTMPDLLLSLTKCWWSLTHSSNWKLRTNHLQIFLPSLSYLLISSFLKKEHPLEFINKCHGLRMALPGSSGPGFLLFPRKSFLSSVPRSESICVLAEVMPCESLSLHTCMTPLVFIFHCRLLSSMLSSLALPIAVRPIGE